MSALDLDSISNRVALTCFRKSLNKIQRIPFSYITTNWFKIKKNQIYLHLFCGSSATKNVTIGYVRVYIDCIFNNDV